MPDYFVPLDTTKYSKCYRELSAKSLIINQSLKYTDKYRKKLVKEYPTFEKFKKKFQIPQEVIDEIFKEGEKQKITPKDEADKQLAQKNMQLFLKAMVARDLWDMSEYFAIIYEEDEMVKKAVELIENDAQ